MFLYTGYHDFLILVSDELKTAENIKIIDDLWNITPATIEPKVIVRSSLV